MTTIKIATTTTTTNADKDTEKGELSFTMWECKLVQPLHKQKYRMEVPLKI